MVILEPMLSNQPTLETAERDGKEVETDLGLHGDKFESWESSQVSPPAARMGSVKH